MTKTDELTEKVHELEIRIAYQDKLVADLDEVVRTVALRVDQLERQLSELKDSVGSQDIGPGHEKPPHY